MPVFKREQLDTLLDNIQKSEPPQVYLLFGERFLCQQAAEKICNCLLADGGNINAVNGETEDFSTTLNRLASFSLFPGRQIYRVADTTLFHSVKVAGALWKKSSQARKSNEIEKAARYLKAMLESAGLDASDLENDPGSFSATQWKKHFGFTRPQQDMTWTKALLADFSDESVKSAAPVGDAAALFEKTLTAGIPAQNYLVLLAEDVDKRKRLYKFLSENHCVVDLGVEGGSSSKAQTAQKSILRELLNKTLMEFGKNITPKAAELLFERVGFHPVAVVMEAEKLALSVGDRPGIDIDDLNALVGRTRQEAVFELTDALGKRNLPQALFVAGRLADNGIHPLAVVATIKNYTRTLLLFKALQGRPGLGYSQSLQPGVFQKNILPALKDGGGWKKELSGHPYALFMQFKTAAGFDLLTLRNWMEKVLRADFRLKGSPVESEIVLQHLLISMLANEDDDLLQKNNRALH